VTVECHYNGSDRGRYEQFLTLGDDDDLRELRMKKWRQKFKITEKSGHLS
jgi:hypothetical protein